MKNPRWRPKWRLLDKILKVKWDLLIKIRRNKCKIPFLCNFTWTIHYGTIFMIQVIFKVKRSIRRSNMWKICFITNIKSNNLFIVWFWLDNQFLKQFWPSIEPEIVGYAYILCTMYIVGKYWMHVGQHRRWWWKEYTFKIYFNLSLWFFP